MTATDTEHCEPEICEPGSDGGLIAPIFSGEQDWPNGLRIVLYLLGLIWCFMGVAIVSDVFMGAIERITSKKKRVYVASSGKHFTVRVWNDTVANLTLMALGSSAPEILLSLIELMANSFYSGSLGPSTIVGSAAFNLLCISAVCVSAIPDGETRTIKDISVFAVTATFSVVAYLWLYLIVGGITKDIVDIWEGTLTFLGFPMLVVLAFIADKGYLSRGDTAPGKQNSYEDFSKEAVAAKEVELCHRAHTNLPDETLARMIEADMQPHKSRAAYRVESLRKIFAGRKVGGWKKVPFRRSKVAPIEEEVTEQPEEPEKKRVTLEFICSVFAVMESIGTLEVPVEIHGHDGHANVTVEYTTRDGTAQAASDYVPAAGVLIFEPGQTRKTVSVKIIDDNEYENDEYFFIELQAPRCLDQAVCAVLGESKLAKVLILDDDHPGTLVFEKETIEVQEGTSDKAIEVNIRRENGCNGRIKCEYHTEDDTAVAGLDFERCGGTVYFEQGQQEATISILIKARGRYESSEQFRLVLENPSEGVAFDKETDGGETQAITTIIVKPCPETQKKTDRVMSLLVGNWDKHQLGHSNWKDQFRDALFVNGGDADDDESTTGVWDYIIHFVTVFWKVLFAFIPPADFCDGKLCFVGSLIMIGVVTAFIGDLAGLLGCCMGVPDAITAITFVALGTSLPDTFASKSAAEQDPYADASIGNVTGSNSVNVFLGLGFPWLIGSIYWTAKGYDSEWAKKYPDVLREHPDGGKFVVVGGDLGFSVVVFTCCALIAIAILMIRRWTMTAELGGPVPIKYATSLVLVILWITYVALSSWKVLDSRADDPCY